MQIFFYSCMHRPWQGKNLSTVCHRGCVTDMLWQLYGTAFRFSRMPVGMWPAMIALKGKKTAPKGRGGKYVTWFMLVQLLAAGWASLGCEPPLKRSDKQWYTFTSAVNNQCNHILPWRLLVHGLNIIIILQPHGSTSLQRAVTNHMVWNDGWQMD